jgi:hypothetical protein
LRYPTNGKIKEITEEYLTEITQVKWQGLAQGQVLLHNRWFFEHVGKGFTYKFLRRLPVNFCKKISLYPLNTIEFSVQPDNFDEATHRYTDRIFEAIGLDPSRNIVLDQPFAGNDPAKSLKYYRNAKAIIVDRDPRELYLLAKVFYPKTSYQVPHDTVEEFIAYYGNMHKTLNKSIGNPNVLYIHFEELVYDYDETVKKIMDFLSMKKHDHPRKYFIPEKSMVNTRLFEKCKEYAKDIEEIESSLGEYIFNFERYREKFDAQDKTQQMFEDNNLQKDYTWRK